MTDNPVVRATSDGFGNVTQTHKYPVVDETAKLRAALVRITGTLVPGVYTREEALAKMQEVARIAQDALGTVTDAESWAFVSETLPLPDGWVLKVVGSPYGPADMGAWHFTNTDGKRWATLDGRMSFTECLATLTGLPKDMIVESGVL